MESDGAKESVKLIDPIHSAATDGARKQAETSHASMFGTAVLAQSNGDDSLAWKELLYLQSAYNELKDKLANLQSCYNAQTKLYSEALEKLEQYASNQLDT